MREEVTPHDDYEVKFLGGGADDVTDRLAEIDDETADQRAQALLAGLEDYELDEEDRQLLASWGYDADEDEDREADPVVAIVGRPNVGKSTIINRILGRREAVVEDKPGVTRDRVSYKAEWAGKNFTLVDTGGWEADAKGIDAQVAAQAEIAVAHADVVLLVVDALVGISATDEAIVRMLRRVEKPILLIANKIDDTHQEPEVHSLWSLGMGQPYPVSGLHGRGLADLLDALLEVMPEHSQYAEPEALGGPRRIALIGRPNVGKSSLLNKLAGEERAVVNDLAGTTRDPVDEIVDLGGRPWRFVDTAGIRRRQHMAKGADFYASLRTQTAIERAEVAVVLLDVSEPLSEQDVRIVQMAVDAGRAMVLAFNKWDTLDEDRRELLEREIERDLAHVKWAPRVNISAKTGWHKDKLVPALERSLESWDSRIPTGRLNAFLGEIVAAHPHPLRGGKQPRILFGTQVSSRPPKFVLFTTGFLDPGYRRFIARRLRETFDFTGTPIDITMRVRERRSLGERQSAKGRR
ncbi:MAG: ribosome biogenesis GTPase Der [Rothia sp. (in: high G+C Gram-positive bacteria)]|nr:ribosome biogenesis GTPase Der [Rothia sp. (in: high G+C Gram-positive bacteria)]